MHNDVNKLKMYASVKISDDITLYDEHHMAAGKPKAKQVLAAGQRQFTPATGTDLLNFYNNAAAEL